MMVLALLDLRRARNALLAADLAVGATILALVVWLGLLPAIGAIMAPGQMKAGLARVLRPGDQVLSLKYSEPSVVFYAQRHVDFVKSWQQVGEKLSATRKFICIAESDQLPQMPPELSQEMNVVGNASAFRLGSGKWQAFSFLRPRPVGGPPAAPN